MKDQMQATLQDRNDPGSYRTTARIVGAVFLAGIVVYLTGNILVQSILGQPDHLSIVPTNSKLLAIGAMLMLMAAVGDAAHGILMFPIMKRQNERLAVGYFGARIIDAGLIAIGVVLLLSQIPLGREYVTAAAADGSSLQALSTLLEQAHLYAYEIGMIAVGFAGLMLCYVFYKANLVPRGIAIWGLVGYAFLLSGSALQVLGFDLRLVHTAPGGLWEAFIGVWLLTKGFNPKPSAQVPAAAGPRLAPSPI